MMVLKGVFAVLVPTRFLTLCAHFFILVCLLWDKEENLRLCLLKYNSEYANYFNNEYVISLALSLGSVAVEFSGFLSGISMFSELHCLLSSACHTVAAFTWSISYVEQWDCSIPYGWYILCVCVGIPLLSELILFMGFIRRVSSH
ncbi:Transmembrane protein 107 [Daphnia magna]|uniref:Transmembrane protein 107 n=1 Tax=Daphnia magna TaxID=35525 RepID=A0A162NZT7_9CRUS|nr:Transmembrane protein 107 [Daphnia magna]